MKKIILIGTLLFALLEVPCFSQKKREPVKVKPDSIALDSVEYKLVVLDPGFESWLLTKPSMNFYSQSYYEIKNRLYVSEWNYRYQFPLRYGNLYENSIEYDFKTDYGLELNYRLYYFFKYFEETNHVRLIDDIR
jgi:hypothetical protein